MLRRETNTALAIAFAACACAQDQAILEAARLDSEGKCEQAEPFYRQALAKGAPSPALLNNAGNHYLVCGQADKARAYFEALLKINPAHSNANLQLARIAVDRKQGAEALAYLAKVKDKGPAVSLLRAQALSQAGKSAAAASLLDTVQKEAGNDPRVLFTLGVTAARIGLFDTAESVFSAVAAQAPGNFDVLYNLGRAASRARHYSRAVSALEAALKIRPGDPGALLELGLVHSGQQDYTRAVYVLAQARERAPKDPEILLALAHAAGDAGFYGDAAQVYGEYLALRPNDDRARLDRARAFALTGTRSKEGLKEMEWYTGRHPEDPAGFFYLAQFTWDTQAERALDLLAQALRADPGYAPAHLALAWLLRRQGRAQEALPHLQATVKIVPDNARAFDQLGLAYLSLDRAAEAEKSLRRALSLSPDDREILMHLSQALMALDREAEAQQYLEKFRKLPAREARDPRTESGMIELATLPAEERIKRQVERLRKDAAENPNRADLQLRLAQLLLWNSSWEEAEAAFRELQTRNGDNRIWEEAGSSLLRAGRYDTGIGFLKRAVPASPAANLELAIATYLTKGPEDALAVLEQRPEAGRTGDFMLLKARLLDASGKKAEAEQALQAGLKHSSSQPQVAHQAALLLASRGRRDEALALLDRAIQTTPASADLRLTRSVVLGLLGRVPEAEKALREIETRWPEWDRPYLAHGLLLEQAGRKSEAERRFKTALALNAQDQAAQCGVARLTGATAPGVDCSCTAGLEKMLFPGCGGG